MSKYRCFINNRILIEYYLIDKVNQRQLKEGPGNNNNKQGDNGNKQYPPYRSDELLIIILLQLIAHHCSTLSSDNSISLIFNIFYAQLAASDFFISKYACIVLRKTIVNIIPIITAKRWMTMDDIPVTPCTLGLSAIISVGMAIDIRK